MTLPTEEFVQLLSHRGVSKVTFPIEWPRYVHFDLVNLLSKVTYNNQNLSNYKINAVQSFLPLPEKCVVLTEPPS